MRPPRIRLRVVRLHRDQRGSAVEYMLILALVVLPLAALLPMFYDMARLYAYPVIDTFRIPFP
jgi:hypothetical protein